MVKQCRGGRNILHIFHVCGVLKIAQLELNARVRPAGINKWRDNALQNLHLDST